MGWPGIFMVGNKSQYGDVNYQADRRREAEAAFRRFRTHWQDAYPSMVKQLEKDLPELLSFFSFPVQLWKKLRTTNVIERCFVEVRRRNRPMVCFVDAASVDRIIFSIFNGFNEKWKDRTLRLFTQVVYAHWRHQETMKNGLRVEDGTGMEAC